MASGMTSMAMPTGFASSDIFAATIYGCPISSFLSLEEACSVTDIPPCVTTQPDTGNWDRACCGSLTTFGLSVASCYSQHAPACFDTSAAFASLTGQMTETDMNPCGAYATGAIGGGGSGSGSGSSAATTSGGGASAGSTAASSRASSTGGTAASTTAAAGGASASGASGSGASAAATTKSAGTKIGPTLKVWVGLALVGSVAVLSL